MFILQKEKKVLSVSLGDFLLSVLLPDATHFEISFSFSSSYESDV